MTRQIERFRRVLMLMPQAEILPFDQCTCLSPDEPSPWFHQPHCPVCIEYWQHQTAACQAVDEAMAHERDTEPSFSPPWA